MLTLQQAIARIKQLGAWPVSPSSQAFVRLTLNTWGEYTFSINNEWHTVSTHIE